MSKWPDSPLTKRDMYLNISDWLANKTSVRVPRCQIDWLKKWWSDQLIEWPIDDVIKWNEQVTRCLSVWVTKWTSDPIGNGPYGFDEDVGIFDWTEMKKEEKRRGVGEGVWIEDLSKQEKSSVVLYHYMKSNIRKNNCMLDLLVYEVIVIWICKHNTLIHTPIQGVEGIGILKKYWYPRIGIQPISPIGMWVLTNGILYDWRIWNYNTLPTRNGW